MLLKVSAVFAALIVLLLCTLVWSNISRVTWRGVAWKDPRHFGWGEMSLAAVMIGLMLELIALAVVL